MSENIDVSGFGLNSRTKIVKMEDGSFGILKKRKSRIIMKDGYQILEIAKAITLKEPDAIVNIIISGPICSKTTKYLEQHSINIVHEE